MTPSFEHLSTFLDIRPDYIAITSDTTFPTWERRFRNYLYPRTCLAVICYAIKIRSSLNHVIRKLNELVRRRREMSRTDWRKNEDDIYNLFTKFFVPQAEKLFRVPKVEQLWDVHNGKEAPKEYEILAGFMDFLIQILHSEARHFWTKNQQYAILAKELTFFLTFLGDVPFQRTDLEDLKDLLKEFKTVANKAGSFIYSSVLAIPRMEASSFYPRKHALLEKIELLNARVKDHCCKFPELRMRLEIPRTGVVDSLFIVDSLLSDLKNVINGRFHLSIDDHIKDHIKIFHEELTTSQALLKDIKLLLDTNVDEVKESFVRIRDVAYEAEYLINLYVVGNVPPWYLSLRLPAIIYKIKVIGIELQETKKIYDAKISGVPRYYREKAVSFPRARPTAGVDTLVIGFEDNKVKILDDLIRGSKELKIISVVGMPGIGKTTIANKLYNDQSIYDHFDVRAWCVASQIYQKRNVLIDILMSMGRKSEEQRISEMEDKDLGIEIYQSLKGWRYLIIIDDVWHSDTLDDLRRYFPNDVNGSRMMLTSRLKDMARGNSTIHTVPLLSDVQCWDLLAKKVFCNEPCPPQLLGIGKCIAAKCNGLPLAVIVIAGILGSMVKQESVWTKVEGNIGSYIRADESKCMKILELSYEHLPDHLKLCFLHFVVFPEGKTIRTRVLTRLWIAEGFIMKEEEQSLEDIAEQYLVDLTNRSLLQIEGRKRDGGIKSCSMHDLLRDMCLRIAHEANFLKSIKDHASIYERHHHLCDHSTSPTNWRHFGLHCRSIIGNLSYPSHSFPQMGLVRVMHFISLRVPSRMMPTLDRLDFLVHLRYLVVDEMPGSQVSKLINLEVLCVENKFPLLSALQIPLAFLKIVKLSVLRIRYGAGFKKDWDTCPNTNLKSLSNIYIDNEKDKEILRCSPHLRKLKCECTGKVFPDLRSLTKLETLNIRFEIGQFKGELAVINFPLNIKKLTLRANGLPWEEMSIVGKLPNLQVLKLLEGAFKGEEWKTRDGEFQELKFLKLDSFSLKRWVTESEHFPKLQRLVLCKCKEPLEIPSELGNISTLQMIEALFCSDEINVSAARIEEEQLQYGNEELKVVVRKKSRQ